MSTAAVVSTSGLTSVVVVMDESSGIGWVNVTTTYADSIRIALNGEAFGIPDAEPRSEVLERLVAEVEPPTEEPPIEPGPVVEPEPEVQPAPRRATRTRK